MALCVPIPPLPLPLTLQLPGGVAIQQPNLLDVVQPALTPLVPLFELVDAIVALFNCVKAIPDALGPPPDPSVLAACLPQLSEKVSQLLRLLPQLSLPYTVVGVIDLLIDTLTQARGQLVHLQAQQQRLLGVVDRATALEDAGLMAVANCAQANVAQEAANVGQALASLGRLIGLLNLLLNLVGAPPAPDLSDLAGRPLDELLAPIDDLLASLRRVRGTVPVP